MREDTKHLTRGQRLAVYSGELLNRKTDAEIAFEKILNEMGVRWEAQKALLNANAIADYYIPYLNMCYEVDGEYHKWRVEKDYERTKRIRKLHNMGLSRFKNEDVLNNPEEVKKRIKAHLSMKRAAVIRKKEERSDRAWYKNLANVNPMLRFSFRYKDKNRYLWKRWKNRAMTIVIKSNPQTIEQKIPA